MNLRNVFAILVLPLSVNAVAESVDYDTPVTDPTLAAWAHFKLDIKCAKTTGLLAVSYNYPEELTGAPVTIQMRQSRFDSDLYFGPNGEMKCAKDGCGVKYFDLPFDVEAITRKLQEKGVSGSELAARLQIAIANHGDPGGTFSETPAEYCSDQVKP